MVSLRRTLCLIASFAVASNLNAQSISLGLRGTGSIPTGAFGQDQTTPNTALIEGAKTGFGYGLDAGLSLGMIGVYAGFDHVQFDCKTGSCNTDGKYTLQGVTVGVKLSATGSSLIRPFVKGGVTLNDLQGGYGGSSSNTLMTDRSPGYEFGAGADVTLGGILSFTPQARYVGQNLKARIPGVVNTSTTPTQGVNYISFDLGLSLHTPFGR
ncbi:MAG: outer membrane beta-barrel protein [Gemmatimonadaceae bacterium]